MKPLAIVVGAYAAAMTLWIYLWAAPYWDEGESFTGIDDFAFALGIIIHIATGFAAGRPLILWLALAPPLLALPFSEHCSEDEWLCIPLASVALYGGIMIGLPSLALGLAIRWVWRRGRSTDAPKRPETHYEHVGWKSNTIETPRLVGLPLAETDFADLRALHSDERVVAAFHAVVNSEEETREFLDRKLAHWRKHGFGIWMFRDEAGSFVGRCGIHRWKFEEQDEVELGYIVRSDLWSQGYATEMGTALIQHAEDMYGLRDLVGFTLKDNAASRRVLEKLGFTFERTFLDEDGEEVVLYRRSP